MSSYLPVLDDFAHDISGIPGDRERPDALAGQAEEGDKEVRDGQVQNHRAQGRAMLVAGNGGDGSHVGQQAGDGHRSQHK